MRSLDAVVIATMFLFVSSLSGELHAYLDPGTGSMVVQVILGGLVGGLALVKVYWKRLKALVLRRRHADENSFAE